MAPMAFRLPGWLFPLRNLEEGEKTVIAHIEEVMTHPLIGWIAAIAGTSSETRRHLHGMDERHTQHVGIEVDRCLHVVGAKREVMNASCSWVHEQAA
jgi:hypothetical protein